MATIIEVQKPEMYRGVEPGSVVTLEVLINGSPRHRNNNMSIICEIFNGDYYDETTVTNLYKKIGNNWVTITNFFEDNSIEGLFKFDIVIPTDMKIIDLKTGIKNNVTLDRFMSSKRLYSTIKSMIVETVPRVTKNLIQSVKVDLLKEEFIADLDELTYTVSVSNNPLDDEPIWEDITDSFLLGKYAQLTNVDNVNGNAISARIEVSKKNSDTTLLIKEINLAFY